MLRWLHSFLPRLHRYQSKTVGYIADVGGCGYVRPIKQAVCSCGSIRPMGAVEVDVRV